ncbi:GTP-binding protein [Streptomyces sp. MW-W600-10]|uniref:CobW family GTP-binding protein n=1 Tax=Streptomyces sp. MW-W600-10 TaxID=2829819 RepID=UPI001C49079C|nr:CobW family GTP-binding protein [Streptomyces sp. MW-W600-10]MBV7243766.1 GTP-binding protein [Streptomyces sp. MW-W600-10]
MTPPRTPQIPVVVLAGFLGSGKTTLLNHLLRNRAGTRIGVIVNDFGAIEIDAMTVSGQVGSTVSLGNGCLCCAVDASELDTFLETLTRPSARLDVIVIEASGLAEPQELVRMLLASDNPHILYGGLVEVVDAAEFDSTRKRHPELDRHLAVADLVVLNKTDRVGEAERERLRATVAELSGPAAVISAVHGRIDPELFFDPALRPDHEEMAGQLTFEDLLREEEACDGHEGHDGHGDHEGHGEHEGYGDHLHASYESVDFTSDVPLDPRRFMAFLDSRPEGLYRIKGFADFGAGDRDNTYALHAVGRFLRFVPRPWARGEQRLTQLVMIGAGIDAGALLAELAACRAEEPAPDASADPEAVERGMWGVLRYVQEQAPEQEAAAEA